MGNAFLPNKRVLYVDDEAGLLDAFMSLVRKRDVEAHVLQDSSAIETALAERGPFAVVISDQRMPGLDGVGVLSRVARLNPETVRVLMTGFSSHEDTTRALNLGGISYFVGKPWDDHELLRLLDDWVARHNLTMENQYLIGELRERNERLTELLDGTVGGTVTLLGDIVGNVNAEAAAMAERVRKLGRAVVEMIPDLSPDVRWETLRALDLFHLGLAVLPGWVQASLQKSGLGSIERLPVAKSHHLLAAKLLESIPRFKGVARIIRLQNKNFDGTGEPAEPLRGDDLPLGARLLHILIDLEKESSPHFKGREILQKMANRPLKYDARLITIMLGGEATGRLQSSEHILALEGLRPGMIVLEDVVTESGQILLRTDAMLSETSIAILHQWHQSDPITNKMRVRVME